jgi:hypothetical protein
MKSECLQVGDYVDVRGTVIAHDDNTVTVRIPGRIAFHQFAVERHVIHGCAPRSAEAVAAQAVCASYACDRG